jgi:hypothetical protein
VNDNIPTDGGNRGSSQAGKNEYGLKRLGQGASTLRQYGEGGNPHGIHKAHAVNDMPQGLLGSPSPRPRAVFDPRS